MVSEFQAGVRRNHEGWKPYNDTFTPTQQVPIAGNPLSTVSRAALGYTAGQWFPSSNPDDIIPRYSFNVQDPPNVSFDDRFLKNGTDFTFNLSDNISWTKGAHAIKFGGDIYRIREYEGERSKFDGTINFSTDANNPLDSNYSLRVNAGRSATSIVTPSRTRATGPMNGKPSRNGFFRTPGKRQRGSPSIMVSAGPGPTRCTLTMPVSNRP